MRPGSSASISESDDTSVAASVRPPGLSVRACQPEPGLDVSRLGRESAPRERVSLRELALRKRFHFDAHAANGGSEQDREAAVRRISWAVSGDVRAPSGGPGSGPGGNLMSIGTWPSPTAAQRLSGRLPLSARLLTARGLGQARCRTGGLERPGDDPRLSKLPVPVLRLMEAEAALPRADPRSPCGTARRSVDTNHARGQPPSHGGRLLLVLTEHDSPEPERCVVRAGDRIID